MNEIDIMGQKNDNTNEIIDREQADFEDHFNCLCPHCKAEVSGKSIKVRYWKRGGCSHNGFDVYICPKCENKFERRAVGRPYNY